MYLPKFILESPKSFEEAVSLLKPMEDARLLSGGTDLLPRMKYKLCTPGVLVSLKGLPPGPPQFDEEGRLIIDANMSLTATTVSPKIQEKAPLLAKAAKRVATREIRNMGTIGGNICQETRCLYLNQTHTFQFTEPCLKRGGTVCYFAPKGKKCWASFMSDVAPALFCLNAGVVIADSDGEHQIPIEKMYTGDSLKPLSLGPGQIITKVVVPEIQGPSGSGFAKFTVRGTIEFAVVNAGIVLESEKDLETCKQARIAVGAVYGAPQRAVEAEDWLAGKNLSQENINKVSQKVAGSLKIMPHHGYSKSYLTECLKTQSRQALSDAVKELTDQSNGGR